MENNQRFVFTFGVEDNYTGTSTFVKKEVSEDYLGAQNELQTYLFAFEDFLKACTFVLDNAHLELIQDED